MDVLVCVKRVPGTGSSITLTEDARSIDTRHLGFTIGPHEECAVEEAIQIVAGHTDQDAAVTVLTVGPPEADEQLRYALAMGADDAVRVETDHPDLDDHAKAARHTVQTTERVAHTAPELGPEATAAAIVEAVRAMEKQFDLILFGNESADAGHYQVGIRVAHALGLPIVGGVKGIELSDGRVQLRRQIPDGDELYEAPLPAAAAVKEGLNLPRYPSMRGRLRAAKAYIRVVTAEVPSDGLRTVRLRLPPDESAETVLLGKGSDAAPVVVDLLKELL